MDAGFAPAIVGAWGRGDCNSMEAIGPDGQRTHATPVVKVGNTTAGKTGLWMFQIGDRQEFGRFAVSATPFDPPTGPFGAEPPGVIRTAEYHAPDLPSPQDWVLVLERLKP